MSKRIIKHIREDKVYVLAGAIITNAIKEYKSYYKQYLEAYTIYKKDNKIDYETLKTDTDILLYTRKKVKLGELTAAERHVTDVYFKLFDSKSFIESDWFNTLCSVEHNGKYIIEMINQQCIKEFLDKKKKEEKKKHHQDE